MVLDSTAYSAIQQYECVILLCRKYIVSMSIYGVKRVEGLKLFHEQKVQLHTSTTGRLKHASQLSKMEKRNSILHEVCR